MKKTYEKPALVKRAALSKVTALSNSSNTSVPSDLRLKSDVQQVGVAPNGLPIYNFKYIGRDGLYQGVMAQDVVEVFPEAVSIMENGFLGVRYDKLGMEMIRLQ